MKRVVSVIVALVLVACVVASACADDRRDLAETVSDYTKEIMKQLIEKYEGAPDKFDADYIFLLYSYYKMYSGAESILLAEGGVTLKGYTDTVSFDGATRTVEKTRKALDEAMSEKYYQWVEQEITDAEYAKFIVSMARIAVKGTGE